MHFMCCRGDASFNKSLQTNTGVKRKLFICLFYPAINYLFEKHLNSVFLRGISDKSEVYKYKTSNLSLVTVSENSIPTKYKIIN